MNGSRPSLLNPRSVDSDVNMGNLHIALTDKRFYAAQTLRTESDTGTYKMFLGKSSYYYFRNNLSDKIITWHSKIF